MLSANEDGVVSFFESGGLKVLAPQMSAFADGSRAMELAMKLVQLLLGKLSLGFISNAYLEELSIIVAAIARQFAVLHNALKFEALHKRSAIFSSELSVSHSHHATCQCFLKLRIQEILPMIGVVL